MKSCAALAILYIVVVGTVGLLAWIAFIKWSVAFQFPGWLTW